MTGWPWRPPHAGRTIEVGLIELTSSNRTHVSRRTSGMSTGITVRARTPGWSMALMAATMEESWPRWWLGFGTYRARTGSRSTARRNSSSSGRPTTRMSSSPAWCIVSEIWRRNVTGYERPNGKRALERPIRDDRPAAITAPGCIGLILGQGRCPGSSEFP